jgi:predicted TPR repeat methyltransferase
MQTGDTIIRDQQSAIDYDEQARRTHWFGPEVVFGLTYEFVKHGDSLLDLGIGSGLSSILFHKAGVRVYGLDGSNEILQICAAKGFVAELKHHDLRALPLPYASNFCNHIVSVAVLNSFRDLDALFQEVVRIVKGHGIFAFTVEDQQPGQEDSYAINRVDVFKKAKVETAVTLFRHSDSYINQLLDQSGFELLKALEFLAFKYPAENRDVFFKAYVARKAEPN